MSPQKLLFPILLLSLALCGTLVFQTVESINQRHSYIEAHQAQEKPLEEIQKIKTQVDNLAIGTLKLSEQGNASAQLVVEQLKKMGITINDKNASDSTQKPHPAP